MNAARVLCRLAQPTDRPRLIQMIADLNAFEAAMEPDRIDAAISNATHLAEIERAVARDGGFILVAEVAASEVGPGDIVAFATTLVLEDSPFVMPRYRRYGYIADFYVDGAWRRHGIGARLLTEIEARVRAAGLRRIGIGALAVNKDARDAYARLGFRPYAVEHVKDLEDE